jgi:hypothetical protein
MADEKIRITLEANAYQILQALGEIDLKAQSVQGKADLLKKKFGDWTRETGANVKTLSVELQKLQEKFELNFQNPIQGNVTQQVYKEAEKGFLQEQAKNKYVTADNAAAKSTRDFSGAIKEANPAIGEQAKKIQLLTSELVKLKYPTQGRTPTGQFSAVTPPSFTNQFKSLSTYQEQLKLVEKTISSLQKKTNLPFDDIGKKLGKTFPELLKDTKLVDVAVQNLTRDNQKLSASFRTEAETIKLVKDKLTELQARGRLDLKGLSRQGQVDRLKDVIKEVSGSTGAQYSEVAEQLQKIGVPAAQADAAVKGLNHELTKGTKEASGFHRGINLLRTALGTLAAVGIFTILNTLQGAFSKIIDNLKETELAVYNLINAERRLSEQGIDVTPKGLQETIDGVQKLVPVLTQIQSEELVSRIATNVAPSLKLTNEQIRQMAEATALLYIRNKALGKSFDEVEAQLTNAFLTGKVSTGINQLGVKISDQIVKDEALRLGLVKNEEQFNSLSGEMEAQIKAAAMLSVVYKNATQDSQALGEYMETVDAQSSLLSKTWNDLLTTLGKDAAPVILELLKKAVFQLQQMNEWLLRNEETVRQVVAIMAGIARVSREINEEQAEEPGWAKWVGKLVPAVGALQKMETLSPKDQLKSFSEGYEEALDKVNELQDATDTPTGIAIDVSVDDSALDELDDKLEEIALDAQYAREDLAVLLGQKQEDLEIKFQLKADDIDTEYIQKGEDAAVDYGQKLVDINHDAQQKIEDAKRKARDDEKKAEAELLLKMKELRQDFLLNLEDALHERDARQVLRLIKEYNNDKQKLLDRKALDDQFRKESLAADLKNIEIDRQRKIESAGIEYQRKLADLAVAKQRELEQLAIAKQREEAELAVWYQRELEEIDRNTQQKIERLLSGYIEEGKIHEEQQGKIHDILVKWFGKNRALVDGLVSYTATAFSSMAAQAAAVMAMIPFLQNVGAQTPHNIRGGTSAPQPLTSSGGGGSLKFAKGGQFVTTKPQNIMVGEGGEPELVTVTPLSKLGSLRGGKQPINGMDGMDGKNGESRIVLDMNLSPDLEARVVERAMDGTAQVVEKINRTKS